MRRDVTNVEASILRKETLESSQKVVALAIGSNLIMFSGKLYAASVTQSYSMFSEALHSLADVLNECLLMIGIHRSLRRSDRDHPYGFTMERYAWALGGGVSIYHGIHGLLNPSVLMDPTIAYYILSGSLLFEGMTLTYAFKTIRKSAGDQDVIEYIKRGADPTTVQVLLEDVAAVTGIMIAFTSITLSHYLALPILDSIGSITIGILLSSVASFLVNRNITALVERRMDQKGEQMIVDVLQNDEVVKSVHDVKSTVLGEWVRFKAEIMFDGERVAQRYLMSLPADIQLQEIERLKKCIEQKEFEAFIVKHGNGIICSLGSEVDRLEWEIKKKVPRVKHCDLEIL